MSPRDIMDQFYPQALEQLQCKHWYSLHRPGTDGTENVSSIIACSPVVDIKCVDIAVVYIPPLLVLSAICEPPSCC
jgi:hypothetical protein